MGKHFDKLTKPYLTKEFIEILSELRTGFEKESLRVSNFKVSESRHPRGLGSALCNEYITTDFSEALIELVTPTFDTPEKLYDFLFNLHLFVNKHLHDEMLWNFSMPCSLKDEQKIKLAEYGSSNSGKLKNIEPDSKSQITIEYKDGKPANVKSVVISTQHSADVNQSQVRELVKPYIERSIPKELLNGLDEKEIYVNPTGNFVIGGPDGDSGLTGRKIIVDTYGGAAPHGGGAFSGKDPTKVGTYPYFCAQGTGMIYQDVLEYRVIQSYPEVLPIIHSFSTMKDASHYLSQLPSQDTSLSNTTSYVCVLVWQTGFYLEEISSSKKKRISKGTIIDQNTGKTYRYYSSHRYCEFLPDQLTYQPSFSLS